MSPASQYNSPSAPEIVRIKASAGAGKTYALSIRYMRLLKRWKAPHPDALRSILAITFTNKASQEMRERILRHLKAIALEGEGHKKLVGETGLSRGEAQGWIETILENYSDFQVRTVDSVLFALLKIFSFESGLRPDLDVIFDVSSFYEDLFDLLLLNPTGEQMGLLLEAFDTYMAMDERGGFYPEAGLKRRLREFLEKADGHELVVDKRDVGDLKRAENDVKDAFSAFWVHYTRLKPKLSQDYFMGLRKGQAVDKLVVKPFILCDHMDSLFREGVHVDPSEKDAFLKALSVLRERCRAYNEIKENAPFSYVAGYVPLIKELLCLKEEIGRKEGVILGSNDWTRMVSRAVREEQLFPLVFIHFVENLRHFLFDEFQDTSRDQWHALYPIFEESISQGGTLFYVGDVKQAIYHWRGGDMELFDEVLESGEFFPQVKDGNRVPEVLLRNYRSHPALVDFFNVLFEPLSKGNGVANCVTDILLGKSTPLTVKKEFRERVVSGYKDHFQEHAAQDDFGLQPKIVLRQIKMPKESMLEVVKSRFIEEIEEEWRLVKHHRRRYPSPIAVLVRSHKDGEAVSQWLQERGLPVVTENAFRLGGSRLLKGVVCLLRLLDDPKDLFSYYGLLASGVLDFGPKDEEELSRVWLKGPDSEGWLTRIKAILDRFSKISQRLSPYEVVLEIEDLLGIRQKISSVWPHEEPFWERFLEVTHSFVINEGASTKKFLDFWESGGLEERVGLPESVEAIRVMTIHKAKGLEFPVVFIPFTNWKIQARPPVEIVDGRLAYLKGGLPQDLDEMRGRMRAKEAMELINLFYVAVTRASERLYINLTMPEGGGLKPLSFALSCLIEKEIGIERLSHLEGVLWEAI